MHWVDRGPEPEGLPQIRDSYTPHWVDYYHYGIGTKPTDSRWRWFSEPLRQRFVGLCAYCEKRCSGEVDHFRPKSQFPAMVYQWSNWLYACHDCNHKKGEKWPPGGYVDPCAKSRSAQPESYFDFQTATGRIFPKQGLSARRHSKAQRMIDNLGLNDWHHLKNRVEWLELVSKAVPTNPDDETPETKAIRDKLISRDSQLSSVVRTWLSQQGYPINE